MAHVGSARRMFTPPACPRPVHQLSCVILDVPDRDKLVLRVALAQFEIR
jgi:hypothetical protein